MFNLWWLVSRENHLAQCAADRRVQETISPLRHRSQAYHRLKPRGESSFSVQIWAKLAWGRYGDVGPHGAVMVIVTVALTVAVTKMTSDSLQWHGIGSG